MKKQFVIYFVLFFFGSMLYAQEGTIRGEVIDDNNGEEVSFADVILDGTSIGTSTDLDGSFFLQVAPGNYTLIISYLGYADYSVNNVEVKAGEVNNLGTIRMSDEATDLGIVVEVEARSIKNNETALLTMQRKSANVLDGISAQTFSRTGDGDAASAIKRVTGVSIEDGKHVFVRGLGDRYTKTLLNGMTIPGLDPDKNSVQMDIFPTNLLDNIVIYKTFTPDLPGDFTGGTVDIATKDFPEEETLKASIGIGYNPKMHFNSNFLTHDGGKLDFLGIDDGTRALPFHQKQGIPSEVYARVDDALAQELHDLTASFNPQMAAQTSRNFMDNNYSLSYGNQINKDKVTLGYMLAANYAGTSNHFADAVIGQYVKSDDISENELEIARLDDVDFSDYNVLWSALASGALKVKKNKFKLGLFRSQNATTRTSKVTSDNGDENPAILKRDYLEYMQRSVTNTYVGGDHKLGKDGFHIEWTVSPTFSKIIEPDNRYTAYEYVPTEDLYLMSRSVGGEVSRVFRDLNETNISSRIDVDKDLGKNDEYTLKFGLSNTYKFRDYSILDYGIYYNGARSLTGNPDEFLAEGNIWTMDNVLGTSYLQGDFQPANTYSARQNTNAAYAMVDMQILEPLKIIAGLRVEQFTNWYTGQNALGNVVYDDEKVLDKWDVLPSLGMVYNMNDKMNLRLSGSRTVARPSFKEVSVAQIQDRLSGGFFYGNIDIQPSEITNMDLRWEYFFGRGEIVSVSPFMKLFNNPIELAAYQQGSFYRADIITPRNGGDARLFGIEFELRKNFGFISEAMENLSIGTNVSLVKSEVKMTEEELGVRRTWAREGEVVEDTRNLVGTSPYTTNLYLNYRSTGTGTEANLSYNVQGERIVVLGLGEVPDVYELPFHSLNFKLSQMFGKEDRVKLSLGVNNILGSKRKNVYRSFNAEDRVARFTDPGTGMSLGFSYRFK